MREVPKLWCIEFSSHKFTKKDNIDSFCKILKIIFVVFFSTTLPTTEIYKQQFENTTIFFNKYQRH